MDFTTSSALVGTKRKADDAPLDASVPRRLKITNSDVANTIAAAYQNIATSFSRFEELPDELQIKIWQEAVKNAIGDDNMKAPGFGTYIMATEKLLSQRRGKFEYKLIVGPNGRTSLMVPKFRHIMATNRFARVEVLKWWKKIYEGCVVQAYFEATFEERIKITLITDIDRLIEDVCPAEEEDASL